MHYFVGFLLPTMHVDLNYEHVTLYIIEYYGNGWLSKLLWVDIWVRLSKSAKSTAKLGGYFVMNLSIQTTYKAAST